MKLMDVGRVCIKKAGREAGERVVVLEVKDKNFVVIGGEKVKKKRCNITHLFPTDQVMEKSEVNSLKVKEAKTKAKKTIAGKKVEKTKESKDVKRGIDGKRK